VRSTAPSGDPTGGLRSYPKDLISSPLDMRSASLDVRPGDGTLVAPRSPGGEPATTSDRSGDGFAGVFGDAAAGRGALLFLLLAAFAWGAFHALSPGHGKAMVAAYLVGTRGTTRHALALGATVTVTHTIGVFALGLVTLALSQYVLPEDLYPWLNLVSGLLVLLVGIGVLRSRVRWARRGRDHHHHHEHEHEHEHGHGHGHSHDVPDRLTWRGLIGMGASAGLIPCPSALVVLLAAIAQHQIALGLLLIVAFSLGLAVTLSVLGVLVVQAGRVATRASERLAFSSSLAAALPAVSALIIVGAGLVLTARAVPHLG
jgi:nickel/cobalt transporter (NicO) family protein